jgi:hypothetical protein
MEASTYHSPAQAQRPVLAHADLRGLARAAVAAKMAFWDAVRQFELSTIPHGQTEWSDRTSDKIHHAIDAMAAGIDDAEQLDEGNLDELLKRAGCNATGA